MEGKKEVVEVNMDSEKEVVRANMEGEKEAVEVNVEGEKERGKKGRRIFGKKTLMKSEKMQTRICCATRINERKKSLGSKEKTPRSETSHWRCS